MTRTAAADAVVPACPRAAVAVTAARPVAAGTAVAFTGPGPRTTRRPGRARTPLLRHLSGAPHQPELGHARPLGRLPFPGNAVTPAGWPADPGRDV
jgi:hypothetical protein